MRCAYCDTECYDKFCSEECRIEYGRFEKYAERHQYHFLALIFIPILFIVPVFAFSDYALTFLGAMLLWMGVVLIVFPFATPETNTAWGVKKTVRVLKWMGGIMAVIGILMIVGNLISIS